MHSYTFNMNKCKFNTNKKNAKTKGFLSRFSKNLQFSLQESRNKRLQKQYFQFSQENRKSSMASLSKLINNALNRSSKNTINLSSKESSYEKQYKSGHMVASLNTNGTTLLSVKLINDEKVGGKTSVYSPLLTRCIGENPQEKSNNANYKKQQNGRKLSLPLIAKKESCDNHHNINDNKVYNNSADNILFGAHHSQYDFLNRAAEKMFGYNSNAVDQRKDSIESKNLNSSKNDLNNKNSNKDYRNDNKNIEKKQNNRNSDIDNKFDNQNKISEARIVQQPIGDAELSSQNKDHKIVSVSIYFNFI